MNIENLNQFLLTNLSLSRLEMLLVEIPQKKVFQSAIGVRKSRQALIVKWVDNDGFIGYGECSCRPDPYYSHEFVEGAIEVIRQFIFPQIRSIKNYQELLEGLNKIRGWNFTKAAIEFAANDVIRNKTGKGLIEQSELSGIDRVPVGISLGLFDSADDLLAIVLEAESLQYHRLKFKISNSYSDAAIIAAIDNLNHPNISMDANGSFRSDHFELLHQYARLNRVIEQPFPPSELYLYQEYLKDYHPIKICLDEEIESYGQLVANHLQADEVNIKPGRVGGLWNTIKMIDFCTRQGISAWIGGMFETGIGRAQNLQLAALLPEAKAHDLSPSNRYFARDLLETPIEMTEGYIDRKMFNLPKVDQETLRDLTQDIIILKNE